MTPDKPTDAMIEAGRNYLFGLGIDDMDDAEIERLYTAMHEARPQSAATSPDAVLISGKGPNTPAMMVCAKLAEQGFALPIATMERAIEALTVTPASPDTDLVERVARAIYASMHDDAPEWDRVKIIRAENGFKGDHSILQRDCLKAATAAIEALTATAPDMGKPITEQTQAVTSDSDAKGRWSVTDLMELAARCEAATGPDRELDFDIYDECFPTLPRSGCLRANLIEHHIKTYTASLDAALTLVPEGYVFGVARTYGYCSAEVGGRNPSKAANPALALCAAALRARSV